MSLFDPFANSVNDPSVQRMAKLIVSGDADDLTADQRAMVERAYAAFRLQMAGSPLRYATRNLTLPDGSEVRIVSNWGNDQVLVNPATTLTADELPTGVWALIQLKFEERHPIAFVADQAYPSTRISGTYRSLLYKVPKSMKLGEAELHYTGQTEYEYTQTYTLTPPDAHSDPHFYESGMSGTLTDTEGAIGFASGFVPYKGKAVLVAFRSTRTVVSIDEKNGTTANNRTATVWDGDQATQTYTANYSGSASAGIFTGTRSGEHIASPPRSVANGQVNYKVRMLSGPYGDGASDPTRFEKFEPEIGASVDSAGVDSVVPGGPIPPPYNRRQIGNMDQSRKVFMTKTLPAQVCNRAAIVKKTLPGRPAFYNDKLVWQLPTTDLTQRRVSLTTLSGRTILNFNLRQLPGLAQDSMFAMIDAKINVSGGEGGAGSNTYMEEVGFGDFKSDPVFNGYLSGGDAPRRFSWTTQTSVSNEAMNYPDTSNMYIQVVLIPDQEIYRWTE